MKQGKAGKAKQKKKRIQVSEREEKRKNVQNCKRVLTVSLLLFGEKMHV